MTSDSKYNWFFKYKLYHLPFWFVYHYLWWAFNTGTVFEPITIIFSSLSAVKFFFYMIFQAIGVYFNLYFLIPKFLEKGKYFQYLSFLSLTIICTAACIVPGYYVSAFFSDRTFQEMFNQEPENYFYFFKVMTLPSTVTSMMVAMSLKLTKKWIQTRQREQLLEKEKLETELKFLRAQFNPHFLFNTINSIFVLITKNPQMATESLAKFSDLLRYQLYECNEQQISVTQELTYLDNFIELEKLRHESNVDLSFNIEPPQNANLSIAPFIIMPFIENAFKHVSQKKGGKNWIKMDLSFNRNQLSLNISNSTSLHQNVTLGVIQYNGIGLKNVQRRLALLYPGMHKLTINKGEGQFSVALTLNLSEQTVPVLEPIEIA